MLVFFLTVLRTVSALLCFELAIPRSNHFKKLIPLNLQNAFSLYENNYDVILKYKMNKVLWAG